MQLKKTIFNNDNNNFQLYSANYDFDCYPDSEVDDSYSGNN
jgi:hypothetical protein